MYQLTEHDVILKLDENMSIPKAEGNRHYQEYLAWLEEGNEPLPVPEKTDEELAHIARMERGELLKKSDWTQLPDVSESIRLAWASYRQALRDVPQQEEFPSNINWPIAP